MEVQDAILTQVIYIPSTCPGLRGVHNAEILDWPDPEQRVWSSTTNLEPTFLPNSLKVSAATIDELVYVYVNRFHKHYVSAFVWLALSHPLTCSSFARTLFKSDLEY